MQYFKYFSKAIKNGWKPKTKRKKPQVEGVALQSKFWFDKLVFFVKTHLMLIKNYKFFRNCDLKMKLLPRNMPILMIVINN